MVMHKKRSISVCLSAILLFLTFLSGLALSIPRTMAIHEPAPATDIVDVININVPVSCSMSATGNTSHNATVQNGTTVSDIGTTNLKVICNDNSGYAIYAIGYTDDTYGKTVLTSSTLGSTHDITTATTVTTGTSSWAMKLASVSGTYAPIIAGSTGDSLKQTGDPDFSDYTAVPQEYTRVAYYTSSTDIGSTATGSNLTTTYRAYISPSQPAGTYVGQVKYTLVHPYNRRAPGIPVNRQVQVTFDATQGYYDNDTTNKTNVVVYDITYDSGEKAYEVARSSNLDYYGNKISSLTTDDEADPSGWIEIPGASKLKVVLNYDFAFNEGNEGNINGALQVNDPDNDVYNEFYGTGTQTLIINNDSVNIHWWVDDTVVTIDSAHDYGFYAKVYPLDENDEEYTFEGYYNRNFTRTSGTYKEPISSTYGVHFYKWEGQGINTYRERELIDQIIQNNPNSEITVEAGWVYY